MTLEKRVGPEQFAKAAVWLLAIICAWLLLRLAVLLVDGVNVDFDPIVIEPETAAPTAPGPTDWGMFGAVSETDYGLTEALPPTPLSLRLRGVVTGQRGYAIIVDAQGNEGVYRVDDEVPGEAVVVSIEARRVVMLRDGRREALELPGGGQSRVATLAPPSRQKPEGALASGVGIASIRSMASQFSLDPAEMASRITILPVAGGGFRVRAGRDAAIFTQLGFHANDIVLAINGRPVDNQSDVRSVFESFQPDQGLAITVRRGDRQLVLTPDFSNFSGAQPR
ncbi:MAG: type II secretion system protein N [Wenzhouxiangellaceae bacterium]|nr:type II secretion system protein N [Wenzhouxiangellaceae bacterium]